MTDEGWYADPSGRHVQRWFDGRAWTDHVVGPGGDVVGDPLPASPVPYGSPVALTGTSDTPPPPGFTPPGTAGGDQGAGDHGDAGPAQDEVGPALNPADEATVRRVKSLDVSQINEAGTTGEPAPAGWAAPSGPSRPEASPPQGSPAQGSPAQGSPLPGPPPQAPWEASSAQAAYPPPSYPPPGYPSPGWPQPGWPQPAGPYPSYAPQSASGVAPGAGLAAGAVGLVCLVLSLFALEWGKGDKSGFLDLGSAARKADTSKADVGPTIAIYFLSWGGWVLFGLTVVLVVLAGVPVPRTAAGNTYARVIGALVAGLGGVGQTIAVTQLFDGDPSPQFGAWIGIIGWLVAVVGFVLGARRVTPRAAVPPGGYTAMPGAPMPGPPMPGPPMPGAQGR